MKTKPEKIGFITFLILTLAGIINAIGITMFLAPVGLYDSGFSGTAMLLNRLTPEFFTLSIFLLVLNIPFFAYGYYSSEDKFIVYFVINRFQIPKLKKIVKNCDPSAFITITEVSEVLMKN